MCASDASVSAHDPHVERLARFFREHPAWVEAARFIDPAATSRVAFSHLPGERWRLLRSGDAAVLEPGSVGDPDFELRFTPAAIDHITGASGSVGAFAVALFEAFVEPEPSCSAGLRIVAPFGRLARRGYLRLLVAGGPAVAAFGASHGIRTLRDLRHLVSSLRDGGPDGSGSGSGAPDG